MIVCGGFTLGSTTLGGSVVQPCKDCTPNLIIEITQNMELYIDNIYHEEL